MDSDEAEDDDENARCTNSQPMPKAADCRTGWTTVEGESKPSCSCPRAWTRPKHSISECGVNATTMWLIIARRCWNGWIAAGTVSCRPRQAPDQSNAERAVLPAAGVALRDGSAPGRGPRRRDRRLRIPDRAGRFRLDDETWLADVCAPLLDRAPQLIGITVLADTLPVGLLIGRYLRRADPGVVVAIGGPGVFGAFPGLLREFGDAVDYVCMNEGELAMTDLANAIAAGDAHPRIPGFWSLDTAARAFSPLIESSRTSTICRCPRMTRYP